MLERNYKSNNIINSTTTFYLFFFSSEDCEETSRGFPLSGYKVKIYFRSFGLHSNYIKTPARIPFVQNQQSKIKGATLQISVINDYPFQNLIRLIYVHA